MVLKSAYLCAKAFVPQMIRAGGGAIVNISSVNGLFGIGEEGYAAAKGIGEFHAESGDQVWAVRDSRNCICPGTIRTPGWEAHFANNPGFVERLTSWYPLGRIGRPEDIANAALFLASDEASWLSGGDDSGGWGVDGGECAVCARSGVGRWRPQPKPAEE
ncbi:MAG: SDR family oxidoreductase [Chloroflexia bacterium]